MQRQGLFVFLWVGLSIYDPSGVRYQQPLPPIAVGQKAPLITASSEDGKEISIPLNRPTVLYVMAPRSLWCVRNLANIRELFKQRQNAYAFVGLSLRREGLSDFMQSTPHPFPVYVVSQRTIADYGLGALPSTIVVESGIVVRKWNGAYNKSLPAVEAFFKVKLPGITDN
jgi:hypothetical protein